MHPNSMAVFPAGALPAHRPPSAIPQSPTDGRGAHAREALMKLPGFQPARPSTCPGELVHGPDGQDARARAHCAERGNAI